MIYILNFIATAIICNIIDKKVKHINVLFYFLSFSAILIPVLFGGMRSINVGTDNRTYEIFFKAVSECDSYIGALKRLAPQEQEPLFVLLLYLVSRITTSYLGVSLAAATITILFSYLASWKFRKIIPMWVFMLSYLFIQYCYSWNIVRQGIALSIFLYAMYFLLEEKWMKYILLILLASLFHFSALITLIIIPLAFLLKGRYRIPCIAIIVLFSLGIITFRKSIYDAAVIPFSILSKYDKYIRGNGVLFSLRETLVRFPLIIIGTLFYKNYQIKIKNYSYLYLMIWLDLIIAQLYEDVGSAFRLSLYFNSVQIILISYLPSLCKKNDKVLAYVLVLIYILTYWIIFYVLNNFNFMRPVYPYQLFENHGG